jgi:tricarballylate dehydrogenase
MSRDYDLVVIGFGAAGLSAAVGYAEAADAAGRTARIAVLERAPEEERGGATRWTTSIMRIAEDGCFDTNWRSLVTELGQGLPDDDYCAALEREVPTTLEFLTSRGVELERVPFPVPLHFAHGEVAVGTVLHPVDGGAGIVRGLGALVEAHEGTEIHYGTEAVRLSVGEDGAVDGVVVRGANGRLQSLHAPAVVIASGGFEGNAEMLTRYLGDNACDLKLIAPGVGNNRGDGIRMAVDLGADTAGQFDMFHSEAVDSRTDKPDAVIWTTPYGILVNAGGQRFIDEGSNTLDRTFELFAYEIWRNQNQQAYWITDQNVAERGLLELNYTDLPPVEAPSIGELAEKLGLAREQLEKTVAEFNSACGPGEFDHLRLDGKATTGLAVQKTNWAQPLDRGPFVAYPLTTAITFTFGGLRTDLSGRVMTPGGNPVAGLYAAGEVTGLFYHEYPTATSVLRSVTFGRIAGAHAAGEAG